jgi:hypothetical protein
MLRRSRYIVTETRTSGLQRIATWRDTTGRSRGMNGVMGPTAHSAVDVDRDRSAVRDHRKPDGRRRFIARRQMRAQYVAREDHGAEHADICVAARVIGPDLTLPRQLPVAPPF